MFPVPRAWVVCGLARAASGRVGDLEVRRLTLKDDTEAAFTDFLSDSVVSSDN